MKKTFSLLIFLTITNFILCQNENKRKNSVFLELGGAAVFYSFNYERDLYLFDNVGFNLGIGFSPFYWDSHFDLRVPIQVKFFYKIQQHKFDIGIANTYLYEFESNRIELSEKADFVQVGYSYLFKNNFYLSIAYTPMLSLNGESNFYHLGALRFGIKF